MVKSHPWQQGDPPNFGSGSKSTGALYWMAVENFIVIKQCISSDVFLEMAELFWLKIPEMKKKKAK